MKLEMPRYALANHNWIGRLPFPFTPGGQPIGDMTLKTLARGRACVNKIIAEPDRRGAPETKQGGVRGNTIAFPQAKLELQESRQLPAPQEAAANFMRKSVIIALAGVDPTDLHKARWAEIPRQEFLDAEYFCIAHSMASHSCRCVSGSIHPSACPTSHSAKIPRVRLSTRLPLAQRWKHSIAGRSPASDMTRR